MAIDPGKTGALAALELASGIMTIEPLDTESPLTLWDQLNRFQVERVYCENVGYGRPGSNVKSVTTFARHCGMLEGYLEVLNRYYPDRLNWVSPQRWMRHVVPDRPTGGASSGARKLYILNSCEDWWGEHPKATLVGKLTLSAADAVGILRYGIDDCSGELW